MLSFLKKLPLIFFVVTLSASDNFFYPTETPGGTPNLSDGEENASKPQIAKSGTGQYVYAIWQRYDGSNRRVQVARSSDYGVTFSDPTETPADDGTPNLSDSGKDAGDPQIATDDTGEHVYAIWQRYDGSDHRIQVAISSDYGVTFSDPTATGEGTPNLSESGKDTWDPQITTSGTGRYVYAIWRVNISGFFRIQVAVSSNYGETFSPPTTISGNNAYGPQIATDNTGEYVYAIWSRYDGPNSRIQVVRSTNYGAAFSPPSYTQADDGTPNLSDSGENAFTPQIVTDDTGEHVYAIWSRYDGTNRRIQVARSSDYGDKFYYPTATPADDGSPNLSDSGEWALNPQIVTDSTGQYVYAIWRRYDGSNYRIQVAISSDLGDEFYYPTTTPADDGSPNLSDSGEWALNPQIVTDSTGQYVYAIWSRYDGSNDRIQVAISSDLGDEFYYPTITPADDGPPNLSESGKDADFPQIVTNSTGQFVYAVWRGSDGSNDRIQVAITTIVGLNPSFNKYSTKFLLQNDNVVELFWDDFLGAKSYKVYFNSLSNPVYKGVENRFFHHGVNVKDVKTYYLTWIDVNDVESPPIEIVVQ
jgi:hypothetical protein